MKKQNELNACDALIEILERMTGVRYERERSPDDENNKRPDVDFILKSTDNRSRRVAVEHTIIELFEGQIEYVNRSYDIVETINTRCRGKIPLDRYYFLTVPNILISSLKKKRKMAFVDELAPWIVQHACQLKVDEHLSRIYEVHKIRLICRGTHPMLDGNVWRIPEQPADLEKLQKDRFHRAIRHKFKKLRKYKFKGFITVLVLEDIAGVKYEQVRKELSFFKKLWIYLFVDYIVVLVVSNEGRMIVGNVWKENYTWHSFIPYDRRFDLHSSPRDG